MTGRLEGKVCIITGAAQGMGEATARLFASEGAKLALGDVNIEKLEAVAKDIGGDTFHHKLDTPIMKKSGKGSIINISSVDGLRGCNGLTNYTASKWALRGITKCHAYELGTAGIRVNSVHPGGVDTPMGNSAGRPKEEVNQVFKRLPLGRIGDPSEIANVSLFLASDEASYITGAEIAVDGGWTAGDFSGRIFLS